MRPAPTPPPAFAAVCPSCAAPRVDGPYRDATSGREYTATVTHRDACATYRATPRHRLDLTAHLMEVPKCA